MLRLVHFTTCLLHYLFSLLHYFKKCFLSCLLACLPFFLLANLLAASRSLLFLSNSLIHPGFAIIFHGFDLPAKKCRQNFIITVTDRISWKYQILKVWNWPFCCSKQSASPVSWFSIECHKTKLKVIRKIIQKHVNYHREPMRTRALDACKDPRRWF